MSTCIVIADLLKQEGRRPSIRFEDLPLRSTLHEQEECAGVGFYKLSNGCVEPSDGYQADSYENHRKAMSKGVSAASTLSQLLTGKATIEDYAARKNESKERERPSMTAGDTVIIADETFSDSHKINAHSWNIFLALNFHFPSPDNAWKRNITSTQHLQISCPNLKFDETLFTELGTPSYDHIEIITGVCLFNGEILKDSISDPESGKLDPDKLLYAQPTIHEMEYIARSSSAIADMALMLTVRIREQKSTQLVTIHLDVPSFHYHHSAVDKFEKKLCTSVEALRWMDAVNMRHDQITEVFVNSVRYELRRRGVECDSYKIDTTPRINSFALSMRHSLQKEQTPSLESVLKELDTEKDGLWRDFYQFVHKREKPSNFEDLGYLFYVFQVVKSALARSTPEHQLKSKLGKTDNVPTAFKNLDPKPWKKTTSKPRRLIINIDEAAERRIYSRSQEILKKIRQSPHNLTNSTLVEVYLSRRVFINGNRTRARLYYADPMPDIPVLANSSECDGEDCELVKPLDVVRHLYGSDFAQHLGLLFDQVGL